MKKRVVITVDEKPDYMRNGVGFYGLKCNGKPFSIDGLNRVYYPDRCLALGEANHLNKIWGGK